VPSLVSKYFFELCNLLFCSNHRFLYKFFTSILSHDTFLERFCNDFTSSYFTFCTNVHTYVTWCLVVGTDVK